MDLDENVVWVWSCARSCALMSFPFLHGFTHSPVCMCGGRGRRRRKNPQTEYLRSHIQPHTHQIIFFCLRNEFLLRKKFFFEWRMETGAQSMVQDPKNILKYTCLFLDNDKMFLNMSVLSNFFYFFFKSMRVWEWEGMPRLLLVRVGVAGSDSSSFLASQFICILYTLAYHIGV